METDTPRSIPAHVAFILDGNGRWAAARNVPRLMGHRAGARKVEEVLSWCHELGIRYVTLYAFSTENWKRSTEEVTGLMTLFRSALRSRRKALIANRVRLRVIGRREDLPPKLQAEIAAVERETAEFENQLILAISYGGRDEIVQAARAYAKDVRDGKAPDNIDERGFARYLFAPDVPDPDLIVRTSGEMRISNFLLWEGAYAELFFPSVLWPDFSKADLEAAIAFYSKRERRFGGRLK